MTLRTLNYGNYGIFLIMGNAGFCPSTVSRSLLTTVMQPGLPPLYCSCRQAVKNEETLKPLLEAIPNSTSIYAQLLDLPIIGFSIAASG